MRLGIRVKPTEHTIAMIAAIRPAAVEVRYDPASMPSYGALFSYLKETYDGEVGLSLRGVLDSGELPNIAYPDSGLNFASRQYISQGLHVAMHYGFGYVNIYPGTRTRIRRDSETKTLIVTTHPYDVTTCADTFLDTAAKLSLEAADKGITLTFETMPPHAIHDHATLEPSLTEIHGFNIPLEVLERGATSYNLKISNNLTHTAANLPHGTREEMWEYLRGKTSMMEPWTRVVYIGSQHLPEIPTDPQNEHIFMPNRNQFGDLLRIFSGRSDLWMYPEIQLHQEAAYRQTSELLTSLGLYHM